MMETNAYYAYCATSRKDQPGFKCAREDWKRMLALALINNPFIERVERPMRERGPVVITHGLLGKVLAN